MWCRNEPTWRTTDCMSGNGFDVCEDPGTWDCVTRDRTWWAYIVYVAWDPVELLGRWRRDIWSLGRDASFWSHNVRRWRQMTKIQCSQGLIRWLDIYIGPIVHDRARCMFNDNQMMIRCPCSPVARWFMQWSDDPTWSDNMVRPIGPCWGLHACTP